MLTASFRAPCSSSAPEPLSRTQVLWRRGIRLALVLLLASAASVSPPILAKQRKPQPATQKEKTSDPQSAGIIRVSVRDVVVDVVVTGPQGRPVTGLSKQHFKIFDDGQPQQIRSFTVHKPAPPPQQALSQIQKLPPHTFTNFSTVPAGASLNVVVVDLGNTPWEDLPYVRQQLRKFFLEEPLRARYAMFAMGAGKLSMVQGFTADRDLLLAAIKSKTLYSLAFQPSVNPFTVLTMPTRPQAPAAQMGGPPPGVPAPPAAGRGPNNTGSTTATQQGRGLPPANPLTSPAMEAGATQYANKVRVTDTAAELSELAGFLAGLPGRKNLFWFTGSFPIEFNNLQQVSEAHRAGDPMAAAGEVVIDNSTEAERVARMFEQSRTAVFAIDAHGLQTISPRGARAAAQVAEIGAEEQTLEMIARETGGRAFYNTNAFRESIVAGVNESENYYTLTYSPDNAQFKGELRHIRVELRSHKPHFHIKYRHSYFANAFDASKRPPPPPLPFTLQHGAPTARQIVFWVTLAADGPERTAKPHEIRFPSFEEHGRSQTAKGSPGAAPRMEVQPYLVRYQLSPQTVEIRDAGRDNHEIKIAFAARAYDSAGRPLVSYLKATEGRISRETYRQIERKGFLITMYQEIAVPTTARYLRLAVRDSFSNHVGSLEIPLPLKSDQQSNTNDKKAGTGQGASQAKP